MLFFLTLIQYKQQINKSWITRVTFKTYGMQAWVFLTALSLYDLIFLFLLSLLPFDNHDFFWMLFAFCQPKAVALRLTLLAADPDTSPGPLPAVCCHLLAGDYHPNCLFLAIFLIVLHAKILYLKKKSILWWWFYPKFFMLCFYL